MMTGRSNAAAPLSREPDGTPTVLCVVDRRGWAHDRKTDALARELAGRFRIVKRYASDVVAEDLETSDLVLLYYWMQFGKLGKLADILRARWERLLIGICSQFELEGEWQKPGLSLLTALPRAVFANNLGLIEKFQTELGRPIAYTPNGVDTGFFHPIAETWPSHRLRVGWAGSLTNHGPEHRGVHQYIAPAVAAVPGAELCLAAREERWRGPEEMRAFYQSLDVYVCASRSEGTPNPCLEAAACGLPIVTTRVGNMPELIRDGQNGFFVERDDADIAAKLALLAKDPELRVGMGSAARASIEPWDWRFQAKHYERLFLDALR
jgi:glycosyltransferase involved in cell wall biosynthesis